MSVSDHPPSPPAPRQVFLFSGHIMDAPDRPAPRFPPAREAHAAARIAEALDALDAGPADIGYTQGAAGADLLFAEAALQRGVHMQLLLPFEVDEFVRRSVLPAAHGERWRQRFDAVLARLDHPPRIMTREAAAGGIDAAVANPFERCNLWLLDTALAWGAGRLKLVCLWNGEGGDGAGGTAHMVAETRQRGGEVIRIPP